MSFGKNLRRLRKMRRMTQQELAHYSGYSRTSITMIEGDNGDPPLSAIHALADALQVSPKALFDEDEVVRDSWPLEREIRQHLARQALGYEGAAERLHRQANTFAEAATEARLLLQAMADAGRGSSPVNTDKDGHHDSDTSQQPAPF